MHRACCCVDGATFEVEIAGVAWTACPCDFQGIETWAGSSSATYELEQGPFATEHSIDGNRSLRKIGTLTDELHSTSDCSTPPTSTSVQDVEVDVRVYRGVLGGVPINDFTRADVAFRLNGLNVATMQLNLKSGGWASGTYTPATDPNGDTSEQLCTDLSAPVIDLSAATIKVTLL